MIKWITEALGKGSILVRHLADVLGRMQYAALVLQYLRPFLGPIYAWTSAVPGGACLPMPGAIKLILVSVKKMLEAGPTMIPCRAPTAVRNLELGADAKAAVHDAKDFPTILVLKLAYSDTTNTSRSCS